MKKLLGLVFLMLIFLSATESASTDLDLFHFIEGTWELVSFYNYDDEGHISDTIPKEPGYRQVKMFYNSRVMWSRYVPNDPNGRFGYGTYFITSDELHETIVYGDDNMMKAFDTVTEFVFELNLRDDRYSQINVDEEGYRISSENYKRID